MISTRAAWGTTEHLPDGVQEAQADCSILNNNSPHPDSKSSNRGTLRASRPPLILSVIDFLLSIGTITLVFAKIDLPASSLLPADYEA
jgi:hypothetical protein